MSYFTLNKDFTIDIHGGGLDLKFPHHENEIAQSEALTGNKYVNTWVHNGLVTQPNKEKINKSDCSEIMFLDNLLEVYHRDVIRYWLLNTHYRNEIVFSLDILNEFKTVVHNIYIKLMLCDYYNMEFDKEIGNTLLDDFYESMNNDFDTHKALMCLNELLDCNKDYSAFHHVANVLGIFQDNLEDVLHTTDAKFKHEVEKIILLRDMSRKEKDFGVADRLKSLLTSMNVELLDTKEKTYWYINILY